MYWLVQYPPVEMTIESFHFTPFVIVFWNSLPEEIATPFILRLFQSRLSPIILKKKLCVQPLNSDTIFKMIKAVI